MNMLQMCILFGAACSGGYLIIAALHRIADTLASLCARTADLAQSVRIAGNRIAEADERIATAAERERRP